jgi:hypothetical protein
LLQLILHLLITGDEDCLALSEVYFDAVADALLSDLISIFYDDDTLTSLFEDDDFIDTPFDSVSMICTMEPGRDACQGDSGECWLHFISLVGIVLTAPTTSLIYLDSLAS